MGLFRKAIIMGILNGIGRGFYKGLLFPTAVSFLVSKCYESQALQQEGKISETELFAEVPGVIFGVPLGNLPYIYLIANEQYLLALGLFGAGNLIGAIKTYRNSALSKDLSDVLKND